MIIIKSILCHFTHSCSRPECARNQKVAPSTCEFCRRCHNLSVLYRLHVGELFIHRRYIDRSCHSESVHLFRCRAAEVTLSFKWPRLWYTTTATYWWGRCHLSDYFPRSPLTSHATSSLPCVALRVRLSADYNSAIILEWT